MRSVCASQCVHPFPCNAVAAVEARLLLIVFWACVLSCHAMPLLPCLHTQAVNMPKMYVIHAWSANFHDLVNALKR